MMQPHELAYASGTDCANRPMRKDQRKQWSREDYNTAVAEYHRLHPCPNDVKCELCNCEVKADVVGEGFHESPWRTKHPRIQILTIKELFTGKKGKFPLSRDLRTSKQAPKAKKTRKPGGASIFLF